MRDLLPSADCHGMPKQATEPDCVQLNWIAVFRIIVAGDPSSTAQGSYRAECSRVGEAGFGRKHDYRGTFISTKGIGLVVPVEVVGIRPNGVIGVLCGLVVGKKTLCIFVETCILGIAKYAREKARHSVICPSRL